MTIFFDLFKELYLGKSTKSLGKINEKKNNSGRGSWQGVGRVDEKIGSSLWNPSYKKKHAYSVIEKENEMKSNAL